MRTSAQPIQGVGWVGWGLGGGGGGRPWISGPPGVGWGGAGHGTASGRHRPVKIPAISIYRHKDPEATSRVYAFKAIPSKVYYGEGRVSI